ncbi:gustatory receptor for sugar taste 64a-like isoform X2 [Nymphalis io]|uniref:gustatory receptor for sugar taste 64a-like isoform X2 n=1 Tax=Inachis io TaxID=171585 RepID=UPI0021696677|nr:gustatory receptor for sugar taste 64a-like isoform X2 [Nymphalis io]
MHLFSYHDTMKARVIYNGQGKHFKSAKLERDKFLPTMTTIFMMTRWFGIPTYGGSIFLYWTLITLTMLTAIEAAAIWKLVRLLTGTAPNNSSGQVMARLSGLIFYGNALLSLILSWRFVKKWKILSIDWLRSETGEINFPPDTTIRKRVMIVITFVALFAIAEHTFSIISATGLDCPADEFFERYILSSHGFLLKTYEYTLWLAIPIFIMSKSATILWNFQDLIIILISMGLTSRYYRMNSFVKYVIRYEKRAGKGKKFGNDYCFQANTWCRIRQAYVQQAALVRKIDEDLGPLVFLSNLNNLYFICLQLFLGIRRIDGTLINKVYYFFSLGWLILRASSVVLSAADISLHSKRALPYLHSCPSSAYNIEIKRLKDQLNHDVIVLSGMGYFYLDRQKLLQVAAVIVKYELILLQYDN